MSDAEVSANPERLQAYADAGQRLGDDLFIAARRLAHKLEIFERTCTEPGFRVAVAHLPGLVYRHVSRSRGVDEWVRRVGRAFALADQRGIAALTFAFLLSTWEEYRPEAQNAREVWRALQEDRTERSSQALRKGWLSQADAEWWESVLASAFSVE